MGAKHSKDTRHAACAGRTEVKAQNDQALSVRLEASETCSGGKDETSKSVELFCFLSLCGGAMRPGGERAPPCLPYLPKEPHDKPCFLKHLGECLSSPCPPKEPHKPFLSYPCLSGLLPADPTVGSRGSHRQQQKPWTWSPKVRLKSCFCHVSASQSLTFLIRKMRGKPVALEDVGRIK